MFAAACVATPARSFRIVDNSFDSSCKRRIVLLFAQFWPMPSATQATEALYISTITFLIFV